MDTTRAVISRRCARAPRRDPRLLEQPRAGARALRPRVEVLDDPSARCCAGWRRCRRPAKVALIADALASDSPARRRERGSPAARARTVRWEFRRNDPEHVCARRAGERSRLPHPRRSVRGGLGRDGERLPPVPIARANYLFWLVEVPAARRPSNPLHAAGLGARRPDRGRPSRGCSFSLWSLVAARAGASAARRRTKASGRRYRSAGTRA